MTFFVAELGLNHNGDINIAKQLIDMAKKNTFNAVKFQKRTPELCVPKSMRNIMRETPWGYISYLEYRQKIEFGRNEYDEIARYCKDIGIEWFASAWDIPSFNFLKRYNLKYHKIGSGMITYTELLEAVATEGKPTFISTGMCRDWGPIDKAVNIFKSHNCPFVLMHAVGIYPCKSNQCNILSIQALKKRYNCEVGYSGHERDLLPSILAVVMGATVIERHITLDRAMWGTDHAASLEDRGQQLLIRDINLIPQILGSCGKTCYDAELKKAKQIRWWENEKTEE